jgi:hypothetical protein
MSKSGLKRISSPSSVATAKYSSLGLHFAAIIFPFRTPPSLISLFST